MFAKAQCSYLVSDPNTDSLANIGFARLTTSMQRNFLGVLASAALALGVVGCTGSNPGSISVVEVIDDAQYYYACGNEVLTLEDGRVFYPLLPEDQESFDSEPHAAGPTVSLADFAAVMAPGPGDDSGTLTVYEDGTAHWISDSGLEAWLTEDPIEYRWVC